MKKKLLLIFSIGFSMGFCSNIFAQTDYFWRDNAANGNWDGNANGGHWWSNSAQNTPGFGNVKFNNTLLFIRVKFKTFLFTRSK